MSDLAVLDRDGGLTHDELADLVARAAGDLADRGVAAGDAVLVVTANERFSVVAYLAVVRLGATAVLSQVGSGPSELRAAREATRPVLAVISPHAGDLGPALAGLPVVGAAGLGERGTAVEGFEAGLAGLHLNQQELDRPRVVVFTSGTTSVPKGVVHTARSLAATVASFAAMTGLGSEDRAFLVSPLASITGVTQALEMAPASGGSVVLEHAFGDESSLDLLIASGATFYGGPDLVLDRLLVAAARRGVGVPLRLVALGGTMLRRELLETAEGFGIRVIRVYGSSEVPWSTGTRPDEDASVRLVDEGTPGPGVELRLAEDGTKELFIRGPHRFAGYTGSDEVGSGDGWFATGDEAEIVDGRLRIVGRLKDVASRNGKKISLAEVDLAFTTASGITDCAAFVVADDATGERVAMAVRDAEDLDVEAVLASMKAAGLATFKLPESVVSWAGPLPTTATGKVQRRELTEDAVVVWRADRLR